MVIRAIRLGLKAKIWFSMLTIVLMFSFFILYYFPIEQERNFLKNYNSEIQNFTNSTAMSVGITLENFENLKWVDTIMHHVRADKRLIATEIIAIDTAWTKDKKSYTIKRNVFGIYPENMKSVVEKISKDTTIEKRANFYSSMFDGEILMVFSTSEISKSKSEIRRISIIVSIIVLGIGILIGFWLAQTISIPLYKLRDAALRVGRGDRTQRVVKTEGDEIGELGKAFNEMVSDLAITEEKLKEEKQRSDDLLLNILPEETAQELMQKGSAETRHYDEVTVMFTDFKEFTKISEQLSAKELVEEIDFLFRKFDDVMERFNIEKIKTIGDAYMCVGGLPVANKTHTMDVIHAAIEIINIVEERKKVREETKRPFFEVRIGINTGAVVAGVVGSKKFQYDIWGDAVNTAARMEQNSEPGRINISDMTYQKVKSKFDCTHRGKIEAKNKGFIDMYFVNQEIS